MDLCPKCKKPGIELDARYEITRSTVCTLCGAKISQDELEAYLRSVVEKEKEELRKAARPSFSERLKEKLFAGKGRIEKLQNAHDLEGLKQEFKSGTQSLRALAALKELDDRPAVEALVSLLPPPSMAYENQELERALRQTLAEIGRMAGEALSHELLNPQPIDFAGIEALGWSRDDRVADAYIKQLKNPDLMVRMRATLALDKLKNPRAVPALVEALKDEDWNVRRNAAHVLGRLGDQRALEPLLAALQSDAQPQVREFAAHGLRDLGDRRAVKSLRRALQDKEKPVRIAVRNALNKLDEAQKDGGHE